MAARAATSPEYKYVTEVWDDKDIHQAVIEASPTLGLLPKVENFTEKKRWITVGSAANGGVAGTYAGAKRTKSPSKADEFELSHKHTHAAFSVDGFMLRQAKYGNDKTVLIDFVENEATNIVEVVKRDLGREVRGNGGGAIARIASGGITTNTITLTDANALRYFERGMTFALSAADGTTGSLKSGEAVVEQIIWDPAAPKIVVTATNLTDDIPGAAALDYIFKVDTFGTRMGGIGGWLPNWSASSLPGTWRGVDRNKDPAKLAGHTVDCRSKSPRQAVFHSLSHLASIGAASDLYITSTRNWEKLANELSAAGALTTMKAPAEKIGGFSFGVEYEAIKMVGPRGSCKIVADPDQADDHDFALTKSTWSLLSMGPLVHWNMPGGHGGISANRGEGMLEDAADQVEYRLVSDHELACRLPFHNARVLRAA